MKTLFLLFAAVFLVVQGRGKPSVTDTVADKAGSSGGSRASSAMSCNGGRGYCLACPLICSSGVYYVYNDCPGPCKYKCCVP